MKFKFMILNSKTIELDFSAGQLMKPKKLLSSRKAD